MSQSTNKTVNPLKTPWVVILLFVATQVAHTSEFESSFQHGKILFDTASADLINEAVKNGQIRNGLDKSLYYFSCMEGSREKYYWQARAEYIYGIAEQEENKSTEAEDHFLSALDFAEKALEYGEFSEGLRILADTYAQLLKYNGLIYKVRKGRKVIELSEKAIKLDPSNVKAHLTLAVSYMYAPPIAGGSVDRTISMLLKVQGIARPTRPERFFLNAWLATAYAKKIQPSKARLYAQRALMIYPGNTWMRKLLEENRH